MRFLIVDDSEIPLQFLNRFLSKGGHQVLAMARNGKEAVEQYLRTRPDVVIMDIIMPKLNGLEALYSIRQADPKAIVIMSCSLNSCDTALESERLGALYCLTKPFDEDQLHKVIDKLEKGRDPAKEGSRSLPHHPVHPPSTA